MENDFLNILFSRHSVRQFTGELIKQSDLETMVKAGMAAPSARNVQPWTFIIVIERAILNQLCAGLPYAKMLDKAGAAIVVCGVIDKDEQYSPRFWAIDCSAAAENVLLAAHALAYGAVWTAAHPYPERIAVVREACHLPENIIPLCVIPVGIPVNKDEPVKDKFKKENIHWDTW